MTAHAIDVWTPEIAEEIAANAGVTLGEEHWQAITRCREIFAREGVLPDASRVHIPSDIESLIPRICGHSPLERSSS
jgi:sulfur relay (sulfurtransferase) DsrC/TusE family protein